MTTQKRDYYEVLGVRRDADDDEIKKAFRRRARELHPDVNPEDPAAEARFKEAAEAYEVLSNAETRQTYDRFGHEGLSNRAGATNFNDFASFQDLFDAVFGGDMFGRAQARPGPGGGSRHPGRGELRRIGHRRRSGPGVRRGRHLRGNATDAGIRPIPRSTRA